MRELVLREIRQGHARHFLGTLWIFVHPLVITLTFMLIFGIVIGARLTIREDFPGDYTSYILAGLVPWFLTAALLGRGPGIFIANANLVKQVVFPIEILPFAAVIVSFIIYIPAFCLYIAYKLAFGGGVAAETVLLAPLALTLHVILALGICLILAVLTPFLNDLRELVSVYSAVSMYFAPTIYLPDWVPGPLRPILYVNPYSYIAWVYQDAFFFGRIAHPFAWIVVAAMAVVTLFGGLILLRRIKPYLGNVL